MSGFVAIIHFDDRPVEPTLLTRLTERLAYLGPDGQGIWTDGPRGFGHRLFRSTHACRHEKQPLIEEEGRVLVADARIDDRNNLCHQLDRAGYPTALDAPASVLIMTAYRAWGTRTPEYLLGDFAFVLWDREERRLFAARDRFGLRSLYYARFEGGLILSNDITPILSHPSVSRELDEVALGDFLLFGKINAFDKKQTPFLAIRQLGFAETLNSEHNRVHTQPFWTFPLAESVLRYRRDVDCTEHFRHVLKEAVHDRIQAPSVVTLMSGGLDSPTVTALATELMREGRGPESLIALTAISGPEDEEGPLAAEIARKLNIEHRTKLVLRGKPLEHWTPTPFPNADLHSGHDDNLRLAASLGRVSLNAGSADYALCPEPFTILAQWQAAGLIRTLRALGILRREYHYRPPLGTGLKARLLGRPPPPNRFTKPTSRFPDWFAPTFLKAHDLRGRWRHFWEWWPEPAHRLRPTAHRMLLGNGNWSMRGTTWPLDYTPPASADPFLDLRVIEFLWSLPPLPWFFRKHIIREAMIGRLPRSILRRPKVSAGRWLWEIPCQSLVDSWTPHVKLATMIRREAIPPSNREDAQPNDLLPLLLNLWLNSLETD